MTDTVQVPREATSEMTQAGIEPFLTINTKDASLNGHVGRIYAAMIAAAPQATDPRDGEDNQALLDLIVLEQKHEKLQILYDELVGQNDHSESRIATLTAERDALREALVEVRTAAGVLYRTQVYQNRKREEGVSVDFVSALNYLVAVTGYRDPLPNEYGPDQMAKINRARALTTQPSKTETRDDG